MLTTLPNRLSFQSLKVLSNIAMPVALSAKRIGVLSEDDHLPLLRRMRLQRLERQLAYRNDLRASLRADEVGGSRLRLDHRSEQRQPRLAATGEQAGQSQRVLGRGTGIARDRHIGITHEDGTPGTRTGGLHGRPGMLNRCGRAGTGARALDGWGLRALRVKDERKAAAAR
ncbi:hypothetical protein [Streptomyces sp. NRRL F-7442]|uniref:hypothetical protein n=1 Tax=Streptomyces sp. NRRL F-7442 TaxID=1519498 RepID=UPI001F21A567|nr:hypothetical protein [Streptomyces sp. NRRL F-7442]